MAVIFLNSAGIFEHFFIVFMFDEHLFLLRFMLFIGKGCVVLSYYNEVFEYFIISHVKK